MQISGEDLLDIHTVKSVREFVATAKTAECRLFLQRVRDVVGYEKVAQLFSLQARIVTFMCV